MTYYTLEKHLFEVCKEEKEYELLYNIWNLNKKNLTNALQNVVFNFPHYSIHDGSHSSTIISNIESFLGEKRIKELEPTDTWLILMSAYSHDIGMIVMYSNIEKSINNTQFKDYLSNLSNQKREIDLKNAADLLQKLFKGEAISELKSVLQIRRAITLVIAEFFRKNHYIKSQEVLNGKDAEFKQLLSNFYSDLIPNRLLVLLGEIAYSHGVGFEYILDKLQRESNGILRDKIHPRFIACLLRLGDLLDVDDKRFNPISEKLLDEKLPTTSQHHKIKHASIKHLLIKENNIEVTVDCPKEEVYIVARQWFDWVEDEVEKQSKNWNDIAPEYFEGFPPVIKPNGIKVLFKGNETDKDLMNLRFSIKPEKAIEIFEGKGIYEDSSFVFIREVVQNAIDASKIQLWRDIQFGNYDELIAEHLNRKYGTVEKVDTVELHKRIFFPDDIPFEVYKNYQVDLKIDWENEKKEDLIFRVIDRGCGISRKDLLRMTNNVGESRSKDLDYLEFKNSMPYWLKPTGAFGIGLQSVFLVADSFLLKTKAEDCSAYEIVFNSSKEGMYSHIKDSKLKIPRGTTVEIKIPKEKFDDVFGTSWSMFLLGKFDYFSTDESQYIGKIEEYLLETLFEIEELNIYLTNGRKIKESLFSLQNPWKDKMPISFRDDDSNPSFQVSIIFIKDKNILFCFDEKTDVGSQIKIEVRNSLDNLFLTNYQIITRNMFQVRDITIKDSQYGFHLLPYFGVWWNLLNPDSDKILNISRSKLINETREKHNGIFLETILPKILSLQWRAINDINLITEAKKNEISMNEIEIIKYHISQTAKFNNVEGCSIGEEFKNIYFPSTVIINKNDLKPVSLYEFYHVDKIIGVYMHNRFTDKVMWDNYIEANKNDIVKSAKELEGDFIMFYEQYFDKPLIKHFLQNAKKVETTNGRKEEISLYQYSTVIDDNTKCLNLDTELIKPIIQGIFQLIIHDDTLERPIILSIRPYGEIIGVRNVRYQILSQFHNIHGAYTFIISPFRSISESNELFKKYEEEIRTKDKTVLVKTLLENDVERLIPHKLSNWIIEYSPYKNEKIITREMILKEYCNLIADAMIYKTKTPS